jgi:hypothetical protein
MAIIVIIIVIFVFYAIANGNKKGKNKGNYDTTTKSIIKSRTKMLLDNSIIDVTGNSYKINSNGQLRKYVQGIPYWAHHYVYAYSEIHNATQEQKQFYEIFKSNFLSDVYFDLEGNLNYAFILLFDLLNQYEVHNDLIKLERQITTLGYFYTKTKSYGVSYLIQKMEAKGDSEGLSRYKVQQGSAFHNNYTDYDYWKLGTKYKETLNLNSEQVKLLNRLWYPSNNFCSIHYCCLQILRLYIEVIETLNTRLIQEGTSQEREFHALADIIARKHFNYRIDSNNYKYSIQTISNELYSNVFKYCENSVREYYGHKRKINTDTYYSLPTKTEFETRIISKILEILEVLVNKVDQPDQATEIELNIQNTNRWKIKFEKITSNYKDNPKQFIEDVQTLADWNKKNPSIENIFFEASKFISKYDKESALILYLHYLYHDLQSHTFDNKQLTKTIQKSLFKNNEQLRDFEVVISGFMRNKDLDEAIQKVSLIYAPKRKKIELNISSINEVQKKHSGTVELLNEYLKDEYEDSNSLIKTQEINNEEVEIEITPKGKSIWTSIYINDLAFTQMHVATLELFSKSSFSVDQKDIEDFARANAMFKSQLIEGINEKCYDLLDDILIEEEDNYYTINENYYQRILAK